MKHNFKITAILLLMFLVTQFIGLYVINQYSLQTITKINPQTGLQENITINPLPSIFQTQEAKTQQDFFSFFIQLLISFVIAVTLVLILIRYKFKFLMRGWFFAVVSLALGIAFYAVLKNYLSSAWLVSLAFAIPLGFLKVYKPSFLIHNLTELLIYPGIAAIFVPILSPLTIIILLVFISIYDMWAVWHSKIMIKMAKFHMNELKIFGGFLIPNLTKNVREKIKNLKMSKSKTKSKRKGVNVSFAILGGGDVVFPLIAAGVFLRAFGLIPALLVIAGAFLGLLFLLLISEKKKFYPAMPFITAGVFLGMLASLLFI